MTEPRKLCAYYLDGEVRIDAADLLSMLSGSDKADMVQRLACEDDVIRSVVDQLVDGWTENASHGEDGVLDEQRRRLVSAVGGEVARRAVEHALKEAVCRAADAKAAEARLTSALDVVARFTRDCGRENGCQRLAVEILAARPRWECPDLMRTREASVALLEKVAAEVAEDDRARAAGQVPKTP